MDLTKEYTPGMDFTAKTVSGLEEILAEELRELGASDVEVITRGVKFRGDTELLYKANYLCRTALRILKPIGVFEVKNQEELYEKVLKIDWTNVFSIDQTFIVHSTVYHTELTHSHYVSLKTKDAIVDQFREKAGKRPWVGLEEADITIDVHISHEICTISLDSSGDSLHKRGYRVAADKAPISEVLAAGMIKLTGWKGEKDFYDPMCGSGTIAIEAAMQAMNIPAGYYRKKYAFMNWAGFDEKLWLGVKEAADNDFKEIDCLILASDRSSKAVGIAKHNIKSAGLHKDIEVKSMYFDSVIPQSNEGLLVFNPPYGKRLEERGEIIDLYKGIGDVLKRNFAGFEAWIISSNFEAAKFVGLRPSAKIPLYNGPIETKFIKFELYEGSKRGEGKEDTRVDKLGDNAKRKESEDRKRKSADWEPKEEFDNHKSKDNDSGYDKDKRQEDREKRNKRNHTDNDSRKREDWKSKKQYGKPRSDDDSRSFSERKPKPKEDNYKPEKEILELRPKKEVDSESADKTQENDGNTEKWTQTPKPYYGRRPGDKKRRRGERRRITDDGKEQSDPKKPKSEE